LALPLDTDLNEQSEVAEQESWLTFNVFLQFVELVITTSQFTYLEFLSDNVTIVSLFASYDPLVKLKSLKTQDSPRVQL
jgi:pantothenate kinase